MLREVLIHILKCVLTVIVTFACLYLAYSVGRVAERRATEPIIEALQEHNDCLTDVNDRYRLALYDIGGGYCGK